MKNISKGSAYKQQQPLTMYMLAKVRGQQGKTARQSQKLSTHRKDSKSISALIKPWKKDSIYRNSSSHKRILTNLPQENYNVNQKIISLLTLFNINDNKNRKIVEFIEYIGDSFKKYWLGNTPTTKSNEIELDNLFNTLIQIFNDLFAELAQLFISEQIKMIQKHQQQVYEIGKQYDQLLIKFNQQKIINKKLSTKINKLIKENQQNIKKGKFVSAIICQMEKNSINIQNWIKSSQTYKETLYLIIQEGKRYLQKKQSIQKQQDKISKSLKKVNVMSSR